MKRCLRLRQRDIEQCGFLAIHSTVIPKFPHDRLPCGPTQWLAVHKVFILSPRRSSYSSSFSKNRRLRGQFTDHPWKPSAANRGFLPEHDCQREMAPALFCHPSVRGSVQSVIHGPDEHVLSFVLATSDFIISWDMPLIPCQREGRGRGTAVA